MTRRSTMTRRSALLLLSIGSVTSLIGCGGGSGGGSASRATKSRVKLTASRLFVHGAVYGWMRAPAVAPRPVTAVGAPTGVAALDAANGGEAAGPVPMVSAFVRNVAAKPPSRRVRRGRQVSGGDPGGGIAPGEPMPPVRDDFYFDYYLGLWVRTSNTDTEFRCDFFVDEAQTEPAGFMVSTMPSDWTAYPVSVTSEYTYTAGALKGAHGFYKTTIVDEWSGVSVYENVGADGSRDKGSSRWSGAGDWTWTSRTDAADGSWWEYTGAFHADGSGSTRIACSDGYAAEYAYFPDGSGHGRVEGPDPGLPATIDWDPYGNVTVRYADGTVETYNWWVGIYGPVEPVDGGGGSTGTGTVEPSPPTP